VFYEIGPFVSDPAGWSATPDRIRANFEM
jgi:hypothetical protein